LTSDQYPHAMSAQATPHTSNQHHISLTWSSLTSTPASMARQRPASLARRAAGLGAGAGGAAAAAAHLEVPLLLLEYDGAAGAGAAGAAGRSEMMERSGRPLSGLRTTGGRRPAEAATCTAQILTNKGPCSPNPDKQRPSSPPDMLPAHIICSHGSSQQLARPASRTSA
jgi:hypothetical protein